MPDDDDFAILVMTYITRQLNHTLRISILAAQKVVPAQDCMELSKNGLVMHLPMRP